VSELGSNPYNWSSPCPNHTLERAEFQDLARLLANGKTALLHAGRGMGKSVMLCLLERRLSVDPYTVLKVDGPTGISLTDTILEGLELRPGQPLTLQLDSLLDKKSHLILLIDEIDGWVRPDWRESTRVSLDQLAKLSRERYPGRVGILVAGGVGNTLLANSPWGSTFASRVERTVYLQPFSALEIGNLSERLAARRPIPDGWLLELLQASGGIPALACQVLEAAWDNEQLSPLDHLSKWIRHQDGFRRAVKSSISIDELEAPWQLLLAINGATGEISEAEVQKAVGDRISPDHALRVLVSAGLVHADHDTEEDPWRVRPNPSVLHIGFSVRPRESSPIQALYTDLRDVCAELRRHAADLFQGSKQERKLVPEATLKGMMTMFLRAKGWEVDREVQQVGGLLDLRVRGRGLEGHVVIEVKIWGRNDYCKVTEQLRSYIVRETLALVAVMVAEGAVKSSTYEAKVVGAEQCASAGPGEWEGTVASPIGAGLPIRHLLISELQRKR
jgi:hypothetical protein